MGKEIDIIKLGEAWLEEDTSHRDLLIIARDGMLIYSGASCGAAKSIANMLLNVMSKNAEICEGVKLAAKHYDTVAEALRKDEAKPGGKKVLS